MQATDVQIRRAKPDEAALLTGLAQRSKAYWGYSAEFMAACAQELTYTGAMLRSLDNHFMIGDVNGDCVGFYALVPLSDEEMELEALFVDPDTIGQGIGRALMTHAEQMASSKGTKRLIIQSDPNAAGFYEAVGAVLIGHKPSGSIPGRSLPLYRIDLSPPRPDYPADYPDH